MFNVLEGAILEKQFKQTFVVACEEKGVEVNG